MATEIAQAGMPITLSIGVSFSVAARCHQTPRSMPQRSTNGVNTNLKRPFSACSSIILGTSHSGGARGGDSPLSEYHRALAKAVPQADRKEAVLERPSTSLYMRGLSNLAPTRNQAGRYDELSLCFEPTFYLRMFVYGAVIHKLSTMPDGIAKAGRVS